MSKLLTFTLDLEDHRPDERCAKRYPEMTDKILAFLDERDIKATVFTLGLLAEKDPALIKRIHDGGHEIAHHSYAHMTLDRMSAEAFREDARRAKDILEGITGVVIKGYRAPVFSLTRKSLWAVDILKELGFEYSSSVLPAANPLHGLSGAPSAPFKWSNGLIEIPAPVAQIGPMVMPYLGGFYFRYLPMRIVKKQIENANDNAALWTYLHPYDFDDMEKNWRIKGASVPVSLLLWMNRKNTFDKLGRLAGDYKFAAPFGDQDFGADLKIVDPAML